MHAKIQKNKNSVENGPPGGEGGGARNISDFILYNLCTVQLQGSHVQLHGCYVLDLQPHVSRVLDLQAHGGSVLVMQLQGSRVLDLEPHGGRVLVMQPHGGC